MNLLPHDPRYPALCVVFPWARCFKSSLVFLPILGVAVIPPFLLPWASSWDAHSLCAAKCRRMRLDPVSDFGRWGLWETRWGVPGVHGGGGLWPRCVHRGTCALLCQWLHFSFPLCRFHAAEMGLAGRRCISSYPFDLLAISAYALLFWPQVN